MTKRPKNEELEGAGVSFDDLADLPQRFDEADRRPAPASRKRGPDPDPDSLRSQVEAGNARPLKVTLPITLHRRLHVRAVESDRTISDLVTEALRAHFDW